jgi:hypothetical protein
MQQRAIQMQNVRIMKDLTHASVRLVIVVMERIVLISMNVIIQLHLVMPMQLVPIMLDLTVANA